MIFLRAFVDIENGTSGLQELPKEQVRDWLGSAQSPLSLSVFKLFADGCLRCPCPAWLVALLSNQVLYESPLQFVPLLMFATLGYVW